MDPNSLRITTECWIFNTSLWGSAESIESTLVGQIPRDVQRNPTARTRNTRELQRIPKARTRIPRSLQRNACISTPPWGSTESIESTLVGQIPRDVQRNPKARTRIPRELQCDAGISRPPYGAERKILNRPWLAKFLKNYNGTLRHGHEFLELWRNPNARTRIP